MFSSRGYQAAGIADIAERLDIGHGTFYRYFESKRDILDHVIDYGVDRVVAAVQGDARPEGADTLDELIDELRGISHRMYALLEDEPGLVQIILFEATAIDEELTYRVLGLVDGFAQITATYLEHGRRKGFVREDLDVDVIAHGINALALPGLLAVARGEADAAERKRISETVLEFIRAGLAPPR